jgi:hypothetical protein
MGRKSYRNIELGNSYKLFLPYFLDSHNLRHSCCQYKDIEKSQIE